MNDQNHKIIPQAMNEIESLNEIVELKDLDLETISGGHTVKVCLLNWKQYSPDIPKELLDSNLEVNEITLNSEIPTCFLRMEM